MSFYLLITHVDGFALLVKVVKDVREVLRFRDSRHKELHIIHFLT